jgi:hypothetical protein
MLATVLAFAIIAASAFAGFSALYSELEAFTIAFKAA